MRLNKNLAIVSALALLISGLAATSASANAMTLSVKVGTAAAGANSTTATAPALVTVPADNAVNETDTVKLSATVDTGTVVTFAASDNVKLVTALDNPTGTRVTASSGVSTVQINTGTGNTAEIYAFTTKTAVGTVTVTRGLTVVVVYLGGTSSATNAHTLSLSAPATAALGTNFDAVLTAVDVFGNKLGGVPATVVVANGTIVGQTAASLAVTTDTATATLGTAKVAIAAPASGSTVVTAYGSTAAAVAGLPAPVGTAVATVATADLAAQIVTLKAAVAEKDAAIAALNATVKAKDEMIAMLTAAKTASDSATATANSAAAAAAVKAAADLKAAVDKANADAAAKYKKLLAQYNTLAKKFKQPIKKS